MAVGLRNLKLGRIALPTLVGDITEPVGDDFDVLGSALIPGEPSARPFPLKIPLHGTVGDTDYVAAAERMRRQLRSLLDNPAAGRQPIYMQFAPDSSLNSWLLIGGGDISYTDGGVSVGDYQLDLRNCFKIASRRTHYQAIRITNNDLRLGLIPRDFLGQVNSTDFSSVTRGGEIIGPRAGAKFFTTSNRPVVTNTVRLASGNAGSMAASALNIGGYTGYGDGQAIGWQDVLTADALQGLDDVLILDRRGITAPAFTTPGDVAMQDTYGWEEVYGPNFPLSDDVPVLANGRCRVQWDAANNALVIEAWMLASSKYDEVARVTFLRDISSSQMTAADLGSPQARVISWTPFTATIKFTLTVPASTIQAADVYVTLRHDWYGPKIEMYRHTTTTDRAAMLVAPNSTSALTYGKNSGTVTVSSSLPNTGFSAETEPAWYLASATQQIIGAVNLKSTSSFGRNGTITGYGDTRAAVEFSTGGGVDALGNSYLGLFIGGAAATTRATTTASSIFVAQGKVALDDLLQSPELLER